MASQFSELILGFDLSRKHIAKSKCHLTAKQQKVCLSSIKLQTIDLAELDKKQKGPYPKTENLL